MQIAPQSPPKNNCPNRLVLPADKASPLNAASYRHLPYPPGHCEWNFIISSSNPIFLSGSAYGPYQAFDNFRLSYSAEAQAFIWQGLTVGNLRSGGRCQGVEPSTFTLTLLSSRRGVPGAILDSQTVSPDRRLVTSSEGYDDGPPISIYDYSARAEMTPLLNSGVEYWISIVGHTTGESVWAWASGQQGNGSSYQSDASDPTQNVFVETNRAFRLYAAPRAH